MKHLKLFLPLVVACSATPFCLLLAIMSTGAGHGDYLLAKIFYPYTMLSTKLTDEITTPAIILAILQLPLYGLILSIAGAKGKSSLALIALILVHVTAVVICLIFIN